MTMVMLKRVAEKYGMVCLLHEKPFAGINGSGKHVNYSLGNATQGNLLDPGDNPHANAQFLIFCAAIIRSVHRWGGLLRAVVASASNDHRLGANEAPPAIISVFLGEQLNDIFEQVTRGGAKSSKGGETLKVGVDSLPIIPKDAGDRNRTSPFAFTGNRFEFRAVGSSQSIAGAMIAMNTIVAESLDFIASKLEKTGGDDPSKLNGAIQQVLEDIMAENGSVVFNGNGYSEEWHKEAESRGLPNLRSCVEALPLLGSQEATELFAKYGVLTERETHGRMDVDLEQYCLSVGLEARTVIEMARTIIFPAAIRYQGELASTCANLKAVGYVFDTDTLDKVTGLVKDLQDGIVRLEALLAEHGGHSKLDHAKHLCNEVLPAMATVRRTADSLEGIVADDLWPLATYQEMLFIM
jgi:glutamine synthetase